MPALLACLVWLAGASAPIAGGGVTLQPLAGLYLRAGEALDPARPMWIYVLVINETPAPLTLRSFACAPPSAQAALGSDGGSPVCTVLAAQPMMLPAQRKRVYRVALRPAPDRLGHRARQRHLGGPPIEVVGFELREAYAAADLYVFQLVVETAEAGTLRSRPLRLEPIA